MDRAATSVDIDTIDTDMHAPAGDAELIPWLLLPDCATCSRFHILHSESTNTRVWERLWGNTCGTCCPQLPLHTLSKEKTHLLTLLLQNHLDHFNILLQNLWHIHDLLHDALLIAPRAASAAGGLVIGDGTERNTTPQRGEESTFTPAADLIVRRCEGCYTFHIPNLSPARHCKRARSTSGGVSC